MSHFNVCLRVDGVIIYRFRVSDDEKARSKAVEIASNCGAKGSQVAFFFAWRTGDFLNALDLGPKGIVSIQVVKPKPQITKRRVLRDRHFRKGY